MAKQYIVRATVVTLVAALLPAVAAIGGPGSLRTAAVAADDDGSVVSLPLGNPTQDPDPAAETNRLPDRYADLPDAQVADVVVDENWTDVPGVPVEIRPADEAPAGGESSPSSSPEASATEEMSSPTVSPSLNSDAQGDESGTLQPTAGRSPSTSETAVPPSSSVGSSPPEESSLAADEDRVEVTLEQPTRDLSGQLLLSLTDSSSGDAGKGEVESSAGQAPSDRTDEPTVAAEPSTDSAVSAPTDEPGVLNDPLEVRLSYDSFDQIYGGAWFDRLQVFAYPACYLTTPEDPDCATSTPVDFVNNPGTRSLRFTTIDATELDEVDEAAGVEDQNADESSSRGQATRGTASAAAAAAPSGSGVVYAAGGSGGNFAATPLPVSSQWQVGTGTGEFSYTYPFDLPSAIGGATPELSLNYSSGSVDGMTTAENSQADPAGVGWSLSTSYIGRSYGSCADDGYPNKGDLCWRSVKNGTGSGADDVLAKELRIVLNGRSSRLVKIAGTNQFRLQEDPNWKVERIFDAETFNGANRNERFKVTTPDGTVYWFGLERDSTWTVPVYGDDVGEPCFDSTGVTKSSCKQAWRWNLDKVIDLRGNIIRYRWERETNFYAKWANASAPAEYDRGGRLVGIEYGYQGSSNLAFHQQVTLTSIDRCTDVMTDPTKTCTAANGKGPRQKPELWPDVPTDLICDSDACGISSPTFYSTKVYYQVRTKVIKRFASAPYEDQIAIDLYTLDHSLPDPDGTGKDQPDLWLTSIGRTGVDSTDRLDAKPVLFYSGGTPLQNLVVPTGSGRTMKKYRVSAIRNEMGGWIDVEYGHASNGGGDRKCDAAYVNDRDRWTSIRECYPQKFAPPGFTPKWMWFHKYVVTRIALSDGALGYRYKDDASKGTALGQLRVYDYEYQGDPAWRWVRDNNVPDEDETWDDWRGYETAVVSLRSTQDNDYQVGTGTVSRTRHTVFRGMANTKKTPTTYYPEVKVDVEEYGLASNDPVDLRTFEGQVAETKLMDGSSGWINRTYHEYGRLKTAVDELGPEAFIVYESMTRTTTNAASGTNPVSTTTTSVNTEGGDALPRGVDAGVVQQVSMTGNAVGGASSLASCARTTYRADGALWLVAPRTNTLFGAECLDKNLPMPGAPLARATNCYDTELASKGGCEEESLKYGEVSGVVTDVTGAEADALATRVEYDNWGRVVRTRDAKANYTTYSHNPGGNPNDVLTKIAVTSPAVDAGEFTTTTNLDPRRGLPLSKEDENGAVTRMTYDPLGRLASVRYPGNLDVAKPESIKYRYDINVASPSRVWTRTLRSLADGGEFDHSYTFLDGWGRPVETQVPQPENESRRIVSVSGYDEQGLVQFQAPAVADVGGTDTFGSVLNPKMATVPQYSRSSYDAAGRAVAISDMSLGGSIGAAGETVSYDGSSQTSTSSIGGATKTEFDSWGRTFRVTRYNGSVSTGLRDQVTYSHDALGRMTKASKQIDQKTFEWTWHYDRANRVDYSIDPDTGRTDTTYDDNSNPERVVTPRGTTTTLYDALNRPITRSRDGVLVNTWSYDTAVNGKGRVGTSTSANPHLPADARTFSTAVLSYDLLGNPTRTRESFPSAYVGGSGSTTRETSYSYLPSGLVSSVTYPAVTKPGGADVLPETTLKYVYGPNSVLRSIKDGTGAVTVAEAKYGASGRLNTLKSGVVLNAMDRTYTWQANTGRLQTSTAAASNTMTSGSLGLTYGYDDIGQPTQVNETRTVGSNTSSATSCYTYDKLGRLSTAWTKQVEVANCATADKSVSSAVTSSMSYNYGAAGTSEDRLMSAVSQLTGTRSNYSYAADAPHQLASVQREAGPTPTRSDPAEPTAGMMSWSAGYASSWAPTGAPTVSYKYDAAGNLIETAPPAGSGAKKIVNGYDGGGQRLLRSATTVGGDQDGAEQVTLFLGDVEIDSSRSSSASSFAIGGARRTISTPSGTAVVSQASNGNGGSSWTWLFADPLGTVRYAFATSSQMYDFTPYGSPIADNGTLGKATAPQPGSPGNRGFLDRPHDTDGDIRLDHRTYNPNLGLFTSPDPVLDTGDPASFNPYSYARYNPLANSDPSGLADPCVLLGQCEWEANPNGGPPQPTGPKTSSYNGPDTTEHDYLDLAADVSREYQLGDRPDTMMAVGGQMVDAGDIISGYLDSQPELWDPAGDLFIKTLFLDPCAEVSVGCGIEWLGLIPPLKPLKLVNLADTVHDLEKADDLVRTERRINGETSATAYGRMMHKTWDYGPGFEREFRLPSGRRVDGINIETRQVIELKPNNPRAIREGQKQLDRYLSELNEKFPGERWEGSIQTYNRE